MIKAFIYLVIFQIASISFASDQPLLEKCDFAVQVDIPYVVLDTSAEQEGNCSDFQRKVTGVTALVVRTLWDEIRSHCPQNTPEEQWSFFSRKLTEFEIPLPEEQNISERNTKAFSLIAVKMREQIV